MKLGGKVLKSLLILLIVINSGSIKVFAQSYSPSYSVNEYSFGAGSQTNLSSTNYQGMASLGDTGVGSTLGTNYGAQAGYNTTIDPYLEVVVNSVNDNLGYLSTASTATATATFSVIDYVSSGYTVQTDALPPTNGTYSLHASTVASTSTPGTEQFGMNLVKNTNFCGAGCNLGADPVQVPSSSFSYGQADGATAYNQVNKFKYVNGSTIALSTQSTGETDFTISYIFNISTGTPAGQYTFNDVLVVTATY